MKNKKLIIGILLVVLLIAGVVVIHDGRIRNARKTAITHLKEAYTSGDHSQVNQYMAQLASSRAWLPLSSMGAKADDIDGIGHGVGNGDGQGYSQLSGSDCESLYQKWTMLSGAAARDAVVEQAWNGGCFEY